MFQDDDVSAAETSSSDCPLNNFQSRVDLRPLDLKEIYSATQWRRFEAGHVAKKDMNPLLKQEIDELNNHLKQHILNKFKQNTINNQLVKTLNGYSLFRPKR